MTVSSEQSRVQYATDGVATSFPVPFRFLQNRDLRVTLVQGDGSERHLSLDVDYSVTGAGQQAGGTLNTTATFSAGQTLLIDRIVSITQETAYQRNDPFPERAHERALDKLTMICQQLASIFGMTSIGGRRVLMVRDSDGSIGYLPLRRHRANHALGFDASGDPVAIPSDLPQLVDALERAEAAAESAEGDAASAAADAATAALDADRAEAAADAATLASGLYPDTNTIINGGGGFPPVENGRYATTPSQFQDGFLDLYRVVSGSAVYIDTYPNKAAIDAVMVRVAAVEVKTAATTIGPIPTYVQVFVTKDPLTGESKSIMGFRNDGGVDVPLMRADRLVSPSIPAVSMPIEGYSWVESARALDGSRRAIGWVTDDGKYFKQTRFQGPVKIGDVNWEGRIAALENGSSVQSGNGTLGDLVEALNNPLRDVNLVFMGASVEWGLSLPENSPSSPRTGRLTDPRDNLNSPSYVNLFRKWLGYSYLTIARDTLPTLEDAPGAMSGGGGSGYFTDPYQSIQLLYSTHIQNYSAGGAQVPPTHLTVAGASVKDVLVVAPGGYFEFFLQGAEFTLWFGTTTVGGEIELYVDDVLAKTQSYTGPASFQNQVTLSATNAAHNIRIRNAGLGSLYVEQITRTKTVRVINQGIIGRSTGNWAPSSSSGLLLGALPENPTHVIYCAGSNDRGGDFDPHTVWRTKQNVRDTLDWLDERGVKTILRMGGPGISEDLPGNASLYFSFTQLARAFREIARERGISCINPQPRSCLKLMDGTWDDGNASDGAHPNALGHYWRFMSLVEPILAIERS